MPFCQQFRLYKVFEAYFDANFPMYEATAPATPNINAPVLSQVALPLCRKQHLSQLSTWRITVHWIHPTDSASLGCCATDSILKLTTCGVR